MRDLSFFLSGGGVRGLDVSELITSFLVWIGRRLNSRLYYLLFLPHVVQPG